MNVEIKKISTDESNVSKRTITYDIYVDGEYRVGNIDSVICAAIVAEDIKTNPKGRNEMSYHTEEYRTQEQFKEICDSMINGNWSHAAIECVKYGFYQNDLLTSYDEVQLQDSSFDDDTYILRGLVTIAEMSQSIRHEKYCNYRPCPSCDEHGQTLEIDQLCDKCEATKRE